MDSNASRLKSQAHTMDGILIGHSPTSNAILVYNPRNQKYYELDSYCLDPYRLPSLVYPTIKYNGSLFVLLHQDDTAVISKSYPLDTQVEEVDPTSRSTRAGTVMDIPFDPSTSPQYLIMFDNGTTHFVPASKMPNLIPKPVASVSDTTHLLPPFFEVGSKITYKDDGQFHKDFLSKTPEGVYWFSYKSHINKKNEDWGVNIPNLPTTW